MIKMTLRGLWQHRRRLRLTVLAVALGIAFMAGTLVLRDTMSASLNDLAGATTAGVDVRVRGTPVFDTGTDPARHPVDASLAAHIADIADVAAAEAHTEVDEGATLLDADGGTIGGQGGAMELASWVDDDGLNAAELVVGRQPATNGEILLSERAADRGGYDVGDRVHLATPAGRRDYELTGIYAAPGDAMAAAVTLGEAQRLAGTPSKVDVVLVRARDGVSEDELAREIATVLPADTEAVTGSVAAEEEAAAAMNQLGFVPDLLMMFAAIALGVGSFIIYNTFSILVVQRSRELALLRALGASRAQVLRSVLIEAAVIGVVSAALGTALGLGLARGLQTLLGAIGVELPGHAIVLQPSTIVLALICGLVVTILAALPSAWRATRVRPIAALRGLASGTTRPSRLRGVLAAVLLIGATAACIPAFASEPGAEALPLVALGALLAVVGVIVAGPFLIWTGAATLRGPLRRIGGITGALARENLARSPERSASTASALMVGVTLVSTLTVLAASMEASIGTDVGRDFRGDLVVRNASGGSIPASLADKIASVEGIDTVAAMRRGTAQVTLPNGTTETEYVAAADPNALADVVDPRMVAGSLPALTDAGIMIDRQVADDTGLNPGDRVTLRFATGTSREFKVEAISDDVLFAGNWLIPLKSFSATNPQQLDYQLPLHIEPGAELTEVRARVEAAVSRYPGLETLNAAEFIAANTSQVAQILNVLYVLLALSVIITVVGIANTLSLSIHERTRELGLLRAVGTTRRQLRSTLRWEAAMLTAVGTCLGAALGTTLSYLLVRVLADQGLSQFALPAAALAGIMALFASLGVLASIPPGRRAARVHILAAVQGE